MYDTTRNPLVYVSAASSILRRWIGNPILDKEVIILIAACDGYIDPDGVPSYAKVIDQYGKMDNARRLEEKYLEEFLLRED